MRRRTFDDMDCSVARALDIVGEWWTLLILRDAFVGVRRFDDFHRRLGISRNVLTTRLDLLVEHGIFQRVQYQDRPPRDEYRLTEKGAALWPVINALRQWGDTWVVGPEQASTLLVHTGCGETVHAEPTCSHCGEHLDLRNLQLVPGPGAVSGEHLPPRRLPVKSSPMQ